MRLSVIVVSVASNLLVATEAMAQSGNSCDVIVSRAWARPSLGNAPNSAAYFTIKNLCNHDNALVAVQTAAAKRAEIHTHIMDGSIARMRKVEGGLKLPAGQTVNLKPGGLHIMLIGLTQRLNVGERIALKLGFTNGETREVLVQIQKQVRSGLHGHGKVRHNTDKARHNEKAGHAKRTNKQ